MYETIRIVEQIRPKYVLWENVKNILSKKHRHNFDRYIETLDALGYNSYYQVLNAKDYGIPQNRERVYTVSIRRDIDNRHFEFPRKEELKVRLKDILEETVEEKYYLKEKGLKYINKRLGDYTQLIKPDTEVAHCPITTKGNANWTGSMVLDDTNKCIKVGQTTLNSQAGQVYSSEGLSPTIVAGTHGYAIGNIIQAGELNIKGQDNVKRVYATEGISPTLTNMQGGNRQPKILETPYIVASRGRNPNNQNSRIVGEHLEQRLEANTKGTTNCISTVQKDNYVVDSNIKIRKLTPKECWRLMGFDDEDFESARLYNSNTQLYKQAGNSIVVPVLEKIFKNLIS